MAADFLNFGSADPALAQLSGEELAFGLEPRPFHRFPKVTRRRISVASAEFEFAEDRVEQVIRAQLGTLQQG